MADAPSVRDLTAFLRREAVEHAFRRLEGRLILDTPARMKVATAVLTVAALVLALTAWRFPIATAVDLSGTIVRGGATPAALFRVPDRHASLTGDRVAVRYGSDPLGTVRTTTGRIVLRGNALPVGRVTVVLDALPAGDSMPPAVGMPVTGRFAGRGETIAAMLRFSRPRSNH